MKDEYSRREILGATGTGAITASSGCLGIFSGESAPELRNRASQTEEELQSDLPWGEYRLDFNSEATDVGITRLNPTGVENAYTHRVNVDMDLAGNSDDLSGWTATDEREEEFFSLLSQPTYDVLVTTVENFYDFQPQNQPSHRNQVVEYELHVDAEKCSYIEDTIPAQRVNDILSSRSTYRSYVNSGNGYETTQDSGTLGLGGVDDFFC